jgi:hypothetical protein
LRFATLLLLVVPVAAAAEPLVPRQLAPGVQYAKIVGDGFTGHWFRVELDRVDVRVIGKGDRRVVREQVTSLPRVIATNASFFDDADRAMGLVAGAGRAITKWSALAIDHGQARVVGPESLTKERRNIVVQGTPRLLVGGRIEHLKEQVARRTAVCVDGKKLTLVVTTAVEFNAFARFLAAAPEAGGAGCTDALNLDGGPSTQLVARIGDLTLDEGGQPVPNALALIPR